MEPTDIDVKAPEWDDLDTLLGAYLHQDLYDVHGGPWEAVQQFSRESTTGQRNAGARSLRRLMSLFEDDDRLADAARRFGMAYYPTFDGYGSYRVWLTAVADYLESPESGEPSRDAHDEPGQRRFPKYLDPSRPEWTQVRVLLGRHLDDMEVLGEGGAWGAVTGYLVGSSAGDRQECARGLWRLVAAYPNDADLSAAVGPFGMAYDPTADGYSSYRVWLTAVADFLFDPHATGTGPPERDAAQRPAGVRSRASTFTDRQVAERAVATNLRLNRRAIAAWVSRNRSGPNRAFEYRHSRTIGRLATAGSISDVDRSRVILRRKESAADGWFVLVSYPVATPDPRVTESIDRTSPDWDALWTLFGGYLHQDFDMHGGAWDALAAFETEALPDQPHRAAEAVRRLLEVDDHDLAAATEWLGLDYHPPGDGWAVRDWLAAAAAHLER